MRMSVFCLVMAWILCSTDQPLQAIGSSKYWEGELKSSDQPKLKSVNRSKLATKSNLIVEENTVLFKKFPGSYDEFILD